MRPALENKGAWVVYVDLWTDRTVDPSELLAATIRAEMSNHDNAIKKIAKGLGIVAAEVPTRFAAAVDAQIEAALQALQEKMLVWRAASG